MSSKLDQLPTFERSLTEYKATFWGPPGSVEYGRGMLNLLTPENTREAIQSVVDGHSFGLNWELKYLDEVSFGRQKFKHELIEIEGWGSFDDAIHLDPQTTSQWDGFRHHPHSKTGLWYGEMTKDEILNTDKMGIGSWALSGIVGRGVLIDYERYASTIGIQYSPFEPHPVTVESILQIAKLCNIQFRPGDILLLRVGYTRTWESLSVQQRRQIANTSNYSAGLQQSEEMVRWIWENKFAALAADCIGLECFPFQDMDYLIHDFVKATWGMPIGELWYLDSLAEHCAKTGRYTCFLSSAPFNQANGVSSVANSVATT